MVVKHKRSKKIFLGCLVSLGVVFVLVAAFLFYIFDGWGNRREQAEIDSVEQSAICDTIPYITEQPELSFIYFQDEEINSIKFQILRDGKLIGDTIAYTAFYIINQTIYNKIKIPYECFLKTDTIVLTTEHPLYYKIAGFHHYANLHYGMYGYLGGHDCRFSEDCTVNGRNYISGGVIAKYTGWRSLDSIPLRIYEDTPEFEQLQKDIPIKYEEALKIIDRKRSTISASFLYYQNGFYYISSRRSNRKVMLLDKINAYTGEFKAVSDGMPE